MFLKVVTHVEVKRARDLFRGFNQLQHKPLILNSITVCQLIEKVWPQINLIKEDISATEVAQFIVTFMLPKGKGRQGGRLTELD